MIYKLKGIQANSCNCFVCGLDNPAGLHTRFYITTDDELVGVCTPHARHQSYPGRLHGGVTSALLDETIGRAICISHGEMVWGVTLDLSVKFRKPVPYGVPIRIIGRITSDRGRLFEGSGEIYLPTGEVAAEAKGLYMKQNIDKIADTDFVENQWGIYPSDDIPEVIEI